MSTTFVHHSSAMRYEATPTDRNTLCHIPQDSKYEAAPTDRTTLCHIPQDSRYVAAPTDRTTLCHIPQDSKYEAAPTDRTTLCHIPQDSNCRDPHIPSDDEILDTCTDEHLSLGATWSGRRLWTFQTKCLHLHTSTTSQWISALLQQLVSMFLCAGDLFTPIPSSPLTEHGREPLCI